MPDRLSLDADARRVVTEELWRSVVWFGIGLLGWAAVVTSTDRMEPSALTVLGLPVLTAGVLAAVLAGIRLATGLELKARGAGSLYFWLFVASVVAGFVVLYEVLVAGRTPLLVPGYVVSVAVGAVAVRSVRQRRSEG